MSAAHKLALPYESKCTSLHGHNYLVEIWVTGTPNKSGMVIDYTHIKKTVMAYDHTYLNDVLEQPTAEALSKAICQQMLIPTASHVRVRVWEDKDSYAETETEQ